MNQPKLEVEEYEIGHLTPQETLETHLGSHTESCDEPRDLQARPHVRNAARRHQSFRNVRPVTGPLSKENILWPWKKSIGRSFRLFQNISCLSLFRGQHVFGCQLMTPGPQCHGEAIQGTVSLGRRATEPCLRHSLDKSCSDEHHVPGRPMQFFVEARPEDGSGSSRLQRDIK